MPNESEQANTQVPEAQEVQSQTPQQQMQQPEQPQVQPEPKVVLPGVIQEQQVMPQGQGQGQTPQPQQPAQPTQQQPNQQWQQQAGYQQQWQQPQQPQQPNQQWQQPAQWPQPNQDAPQGQQNSKGPRFSGPMRQEGEPSILKLPWSQEVRDYQAAHPVENESPVVKWLARAGFFFMGVFGGFLGVMAVWLMASALNSTRKNEAFWIAWLGLGVQAIFMITVGIGNGGTGWIGAGSAGSGATGGSTGSGGSAFG